MGNNVGLGLLPMAFCFDFCSSNIVQLSNRNLYSIPVSMSSPINDPAYLFWITQKWAALYSSGPSWLPFCALQSWLKALIVTDKPSRKFLDANSHVHAFNHWVVTLKKNLFLDREKWSRSRKKPDILVVPLSKGSGFPTRSYVSRRSLGNRGSPVEHTKVYSI